jgi:oxalate---CoA ligase
VQPPVSPASSLSLPSMEMEIDAEEEHGKTVDGLIACCKRNSDGLVDCLSCLEEESTVFADSLRTEEQPVALQILEIFRGRGSEGMTRSDLNVSFDF